VLLGTLTACEREQPVEVFVPPSGDAAAGKQVFIKYQCYNCHTIPDIDFPERATEPTVAELVDPVAFLDAEYARLLGR
jgi:cytochrome c2